MNIDFSPVLLTMCKYLGAAALQSNNGALQERIRFTRMVDMFLQSPLRQAIMQEANLRNDLLDMFVNWVMELRAMDPRTLRSEEAHQSKLLIDLTVSTMRALIQVLEKLPVKPMSNPGPAAAAAANQPTDVRSLRGRAYRRYFDFFVRFMSQCRMIEIQEFSSMTSVHATHTAATAALNSVGIGGGGGSGSGGVSSPTTNPRGGNGGGGGGRSGRSESFIASSSDVGVGRDIARNIYSASGAQGAPQRFNRELSQSAELLLNITIKALTNMLAANLEIGLQYSLSVIYHEDTKLRALFTDMFTTILNQGIDIDSLGGDTAEHWRARLIETLVDPGLKLLLGINEVCQVQDIDELGASLINIFESRQQTKILFERIITLHGDGYLKQTLVPAVRKLLAQPPGTLTFELNPNKMAESADRDRNLKNVERLCSLVIDAIVGSVGTLPATLRWICNLIYRIVITRFPDAGYTAVGGFVFLRFLCPAIVAPDAHGICAQISNPEVRRGLLLCTKITHNLANDILFGNKETYMVPLNKFISENRARTMRFLSELAAEVADDGESIFEGAAKSIASSAAGSVAVGGRPSTDYVASEAETTADAGVAAGGGLADGRDFVVVQRFIFDHLDRLEPYLARESMVRMHVAAKPSERRKSARAAARAAAAASAAGGSSEKTGEAEAAAAAAAAGEVSASQNLFTQLSYVMRQVGPPAAAAATADANAAGGAAASRMVAEAGGGNGGSSGEELFHEILRRDAHRSTDAIAKKAIIYVGGVSREKRPVVYVIARRMQMQYLDMDAVLLHTLRLLEPLGAKGGFEPLGAKGGFEVFFDLTQFGPANEVPLQWLRQLKRVIPESLVGSVQAVYWYNVNSHFRKYAKAGGLALPPRLAKRSVFPHSLSDLHEFLASPQADLPPGTVSLDSDNGINITPVSRVSRTSPAMPCLIKVTPEAVQITALRRQEVFGLSTYFNDVYHITEIADLQIMPLAEQAIYGETDGESSHRVRSALQRTASRGSEGDRSSVGGSGSRGDEALVVALRFEGGGGAATLFTSAKAELLYKAVRNARARYTSHAAVNQAPERVIRPADVPGTLLNAALLNMGAENAGLRISAYRMLISVVATFSLDVGHELAFASDLCLPPNPLQFTFRICSRLSRSAPDMTLELLGEALLAFTRSAQNMKPWILHYIQPWLLGLAPFAHASAAHPDAAARTQDIVRSLVRLHLKEPTMYMHFKEHVWALVARVEELVDLVLDVMVAVALEYGALTVETELIADMLATVAGKNPRYNKLVPRLRRLVALTCAPAVAHVAAHPVWPEIAVHLRLLLTMSFSNRALADDFLPDVALVTCLLLRAGPGLIQATLHGIVMHVVHSLALGQCNGAIIDATFSSAITGANSFAGAPVRQLAAAEEGGAGGGLVLSPYAQLAAQLAELIQTRTKFNFGLRAKATSAVTFIASSYTRGGAASTLNPEALMEFKDELGGTPAAAAAAAAESPREALAGVDRVAQLFLRIMDNPAYADGRGNAWRARWATLVTASTFVFNPAIQPRAFVLLGRLAAHDEVDDDLLYQTLATLRGALAAFGETDEALPISVLLCLVHMVANLPPDSSYLASLFWVAVAVMQIGHLPLYRVGLSLLSRVLRALDACGAFHADNGDGFQHFLMAARVAVEKAADQVDDAVAISFRSSFSASLSLLLLRGMEDMSTKDETYEVLLQIVAIVASCRKWQQADHATPDRKCDLILPYLILILPTASARNELVHVFTLAGTAISADIKLGMEQGGYVRLLEQIHKSDIARNCQSDYIIYPSILAAMLHKSRANQEIMILYSVLASKVAWVDATMSLLVIESLAPTMTSAMHSSHSSKLTHKLHDVMVRLVITRPHFDPDVFIQQQTLLQLSSGTGVPAATLADIAHSLTVDAIASTTRKSVGIVPPPPRSREDSAERPSMLANVRSQDTISLVSKQSSSPSFANNNIGSHHSPESSFDRAMVPAHREYLSRIGFGGLGRVIVFESSMPHWRELAELASLVVDQML
ncbi:Ras GTPase activating protein ira2 [Coemansia sp. RSA 2320]|nr:Ras GTPase activating protein ira2 [Coemansia sp. RSA 2320]